MRTRASGWMALAVVVLASCTAGPAMTVAPAALLVTASVTEAAPGATVEVALEAEPDVTLEVHVAHSRRGLAGFGFGRATTRTLQVVLVFQEPRALGPGSYQDLVTIQVCADPACAREVPGSPREVTVTYQVNSSVPSASRLFPATAPIGPAVGVQVQVDGQGFLAGSTFLWNGSPRPTDVVSSTLLVGTLQPGDLDRLGEASVAVRNPGPGGGTSASLTFQVFDGSSPVLDSLSPDRVGAGAPGFLLTLRGSNFLPTSQVGWQSFLLTTHFVSPTVLTAEVPASLLATPAAVPELSPRVWVDNFATGGGTSQQLQFLLLAPPELHSFTPAFLRAGDPPATLTAYGSGLLPGARLTWNGVERPATVASFYHLDIPLGAEDLAAPGASTFQVSNGDFFGADSQPLTYRVLPAPAPVLPTDAVAYQVDPAHRGATSFRTLALPGAPAWQVDLGGRLSYPLVVGGTVLVSVERDSSHWRVLALDQASGALRWAADLFGPAELAFERGRVVAATSFDYDVYDLETGTLAWRAALTPYGLGSTGAVAAGGAVMITPAGAGSARLRLRISDGAPAWSLGVNAGDGSPPAVTDRGLFHAGACATEAVDPDTGAVRWTDPGECTTPPGWPPVAGEGVVYTPADPATGMGRILDQATGARLGTYLGDGPPALTPGVAYVVHQGALRALSRGDGGVRWTFAPDAGLVTAPLVVNQYVFVGTAGGTLHAVDATTGLSAWSYRLDGGLPSPAVPPTVDAVRSGLAAGGGLLVVPAGTTLTAFRLSADP